MARLFNGAISNGPRAVYVNAIDVSDLIDCTITFFIRTPSANPVRGYVFAEMITVDNARFFIEFGDAGGAAQRFRVFVNHSVATTQYSSVAPGMSVDTWYFVALRRTGSPAIATNFEWLIGEVNSPAALTNLATSFTSDAGGPIAAAATESVIGNRRAGDRTLTGQIAYPQIHDSSLSNTLLEEIRRGNLTASASIVAEPDFTLAGDGNDPTLGGLGTVSFAGVPTPSEAADPVFNRTAAVATSMPVVSHSADATNSSAPSINRFLSGTTPLPLLGQSIGAVNVAPVPVTFFNQFENANLNVAASSVGGTADNPVCTLVYHRRPVTNAFVSATTGGISGLEGRQSVTVEVDFSAATQSLSPTQKLYWRLASEGFNDFRLFDTVTVVADVITGVIDVSMAEVTGPIVCGAAPTFGPTEFNAEMDRWLAESPHVTSPPGVTDGVLATLNSISNKNTGYVTGPMRQMAVMITDAQAPENPGQVEKINILITVGQHSIEELSRHAAFGAVEWLLGGSVQANKALRNFRFFLVFVNPQGCAAMELEYGTGDPADARQSTNINRTWDEANPSAAIVNTKAFMSSMIATYGPFAFWNDIHNRNLDGEDAIFQTLGRHPAIDAFRPAMQTIFGSPIIHHNDGTDAGIATQWAWASLNNTPGNTPEQNHHQNVNVQPVNDFQRWGAAMAETHQAMLEAGVYGDFVPAVAATVTSAAAFLVQGMAATNSSGVVSLVTPPSRRAQAPVRSRRAQAVIDTRIR